MKNLLLSTAMLAATTLGASAQDMFRGEAAPDEIRASDLMGMRVYASADASDATEIDGVQDNWDDIGEVGDIVLGRDGSVQAVLVDVGGFLGIGERTVAVDMSSIHMVSDSATPDDLNDYFLVINADRAALENAPEYMAGDDMAANADMSSDQAAAVADSSDAAAAAGTEPTDEVMAEPADGTDAAADTAMTEGEMEAQDTAEAATDDVTTDATATTDTAETTTETVPVETTDTAAMDSTDAAATDDTMATDDTAATDDTMAADDTMATDDTAMATDTAATDDTMAADDTMATDGTVATDDTAMADGTMAEGDAAARVPYSREGYAPLGQDMMTADALDGAAVYDVNDDRVGEIGELLIDDQGMITNVVIDVGGFLGIGEKPVSLPLDSVDILKQDGGDDLRVYVSQTEDELKAMDSYSAD